MQMPSWCSLVFKSLIACNCKNLAINFLALQIKEITRQIAERFEISGPMNIQFLAKGDDIMVGFDKVHFNMIVFIHSLFSSLLFHSISFIHKKPSIKSKYIRFVYHDDNSENKNLQPYKT